MTDTKTYPVSVAALLLVICAYHVNGLMCPAVFNGTSEQWCADCTHFVKPRCCAFSPNATCDDECNNCTVSWHCLAAAEGQTCEVSLIRFCYRLLLFLFSLFLLLLHLELLVFSQLSIYLIFSFSIGLL